MDSIRHGTASRYLALLGLAACALPARAAFRPPATPLVTHDPFLSIWSEASALTDANTVHWTNRKDPQHRHEHPLACLVTIDGRPYRVMGAEPRRIQPMPQIAMSVTPTRSSYRFEDNKVGITLTFMTAALPDDLEAFSRPLTYVTWDVRSLDRIKHDVSLYFSASSLLAVNRPDEPVRVERGSAGAMTYLRAGTIEQPILGSSGDDHRINWGFAYVSAALQGRDRALMGDSARMMDEFVNGDRPQEGLSERLETTGDTSPAMALTFNLGPVDRLAVSRRAIVAYDEIYAIKYFGHNLRPYWRRNGATPAGLLQVANADYPRLAQRCWDFDRELMADATKAGGPKYAQMCALAYRQALGACGLAADDNKQPLFFTKENTSNGDIATVDVIYPMDPMLILLSPTLAKATLVPVLSYASSWHWKYPNAPHDLGTYPNAPGRDDGGEGMPVEESGNMLLLCDAIAQAEGNARFVSPWWPTLTKWAKFLEQYGLDPANQLCTDDFMGHLAHNANLSVKAILGLAAYGDLCRMRGDKASADRYQKLARADAKHWMTVAADGDHSRLAFDRPGTWSQKYNLVWDRILGLNVFPPAVARQEVAYYKKMMQRYGVPLDSRTRLTKADWSVWSATLATEQADFEAIISPIYDYLNETTARSPFADSYVTDDVSSVGMHARPVIGGVFMKMLADRGVWKKWASRDKAKPGNWAPLPKPPKVTEVVPTSRKQPQTWRYTTERPAAGWADPQFDDSAWAEGKGAFGTPGTPGAEMNTTWNTGDIWMRRQFTMPSGTWRNLQLLAYHDEDVEIYVNGVLAAVQNGFTTSYEPIEIRPLARARIKPGATVVLAAHCHQTEGGQGVDVGLAEVTAPKK